MPQAVFLNSGISGYEYLDKIVQLPFCLPNIEERKKRAYLSKMVEAKELDPKRVLSRVQKELQEASLYVPFKKLPEPTRSSDDGGNLRSENQMRALVNAARGMRKANLLVNDPMRRAEMGISEDGLIEQIETDGIGARDDRKESFLFMLSEEAKVQKSKRLTQAQSERPAEPDNQPSAERGATAAVVEKGDGSASSPGGEGGAVSEAAAENERPEQEPRFLLADAGSIGRSNDQEARCVLQWNGVVQAGLWGGVESRAESLSVGRVGDQLPGDGKWRGGVLAADGNIYGIPYNATQVLRFDPRTQQATLVGDELPGGYKWRGGVLAADGNIYGIPCNATQVLRFDPRTQQATLVGAELPGGAKWYGGVLAADGNIYGIPCDATQVLRFDPRTQQATLVGAELPGGAKWYGGVLAADGNIYGIPCNATQVLRFDPRTQQATLVGAELPGGAKWYGGVLAADGNIYGIPCDATQVLRFDPRTQQATLVGDQLPGDYKWFGGVLAADGNIYGIPWHATQVLRFDPRTQQATLVGAQLPGDYKWFGGVLAADGNIYGIPCDATQVLRLALDLPEATAELVLELDEQSSEYARLESDDPASTPAQPENSLRLPARGCGASVRLVAREGYELGMGQIGISVTIEHVQYHIGVRLVAREDDELGMEPISMSFKIENQPVVLLSSKAHYKIRLPEARFGIVQDQSYAPMMDENERACLDRLCPFADGNPRRLKRIINVFNVGRRVVELRRGEKWPGLTEFKPKLLKFVIMLEQWPYRAPACLRRWLPPLCRCCIVQQEPWLGSA